MKKLQHRNRSPYGGGYNIDRPDLGVVAYGSTFKQLESKAAAYRKANGIPTGLGFSDELEALVCELYPAECEEKDPNLPPTNPRRLHLSEVISGTKLMISFWAKGKPVVPVEEATRRAKICSTCKYNVQFPLPCGGHCGDLKTIVTSLIGSQATPYEDQLRSCNLCGCYLSASIWVDLSLQWKALSEEQRNQFLAVEWCWKHSPPAP